jgi:Sulfotransferase domain
MALMVIGPAFGRTGTASLKLALEHLGFGPCHHMEEVFGHPEQVPFWQDAAAGRPADWETVFAGYRSQVDWPGAHWWRDLAAAFPAARVVLSVRPEEAWYASFSATIGVVMRDHETLPMPPPVAAMVSAMVTVMTETFGGLAPDKATALASYRRRIADVRAGIAPERLLVFDVAEGWAPLCGFLGVPVPDRPFPRVNTTAEFWEVLRGGRPH